MHLQEHVIEGDTDLSRNQDNDRPLKGVRLFVLHEFQKVLEILLYQLQLVLDRVKPRLQEVPTLNAITSGSTSKRMQIMN